jgi:hypothetical protein
MEIIARIISWALLVALVSKAGMDPFNAILALLGVSLALCCIPLVYRWVLRPLFFAAIFVAAAPLALALRVAVGILNLMGAAWRGEIRPN